MTQIPFFWGGWWYQGTTVHYFTAELSKFLHGKGKNKLFSKKKLKRGHKEKKTFKINGPDFSIFKNERDSSIQSFSSFFSLCAIFVRCYGLTKAKYIYYIERVRKIL